MGTAPNKGSLGFAGEPHGVEWGPHGVQLPLKTRLVVRDGSGRGSV